MTDPQELYDRMTRTARAVVARGETSRELRAQAEAEERRGELSAVYTRLLASRVEELEISGSGRGNFAGGGNAYCD